jgi:hypothetical protein
MDLLLPPAFKADPPKLEIKKDLKGMVTVAGATIVEVRTDSRFTEWAGSPESAVVSWHCVSYLASRSVDTSSPL